MYTYAFLRQSESGLNLPEGIVGSLQAIAAEGIAAIVEPDLRIEQIQESDDRLMQAVLWHDRVLQDLFSQVTVLPLRFGTQFVSLEKLVEHLKSNATDYHRKLDQLTGKAEYTIKLVPREFSGPATPVQGSGRDYFLAKKQRVQSQVEYQQQQMEVLPLLRQAIAQTYPLAIFSESRDSIERCYVLIPRSAEADLFTNLDTWQQQYSPWELSLSEALPPYHFV